MKDNELSVGLVGWLVNDAGFELGQPTRVEMLQHDNRLLEAGLVRLFAASSNWPSRSWITALFSQLEAWISSWILLLRVSWVITCRLSSRCTCRQGAEVMPKGPLSCLMGTVDIYSNRGALIGRGWSDEK